MKFSDMPEDERTEILDAVRDSYLTATGTPRSHAAALTEFAHLLDDAEQAHRPWVRDLRNAWMFEGMRKFIQDQWKAIGKPFVVMDKKGGSHVRSTKRGVLRPDESGKQAWTQMELLDWNADDLQLALNIAATHVEEQRVNIGMFRRLLDLMDRTGKETVGEALSASGVTLDEFLNADSAAS